MAVSRKNSTTEFNRKLARKGKEKYVLRLFVAGLTPKSQKAIENIRKICGKFLEGRYELEIIDIYQKPIFARDGQIVAAPTLIKELPAPLRRFVGDMSNTDKLVLGLDLTSKT